MTIPAPRRASFLLLSALSLSACGSAVTSPTPMPSPSTAAASPTATATEDPNETVPAETLGPIEPGQTETGWGRVWDTLPKGFPLYSGATVSDEAQTGPSSGVYTVDGAAETIATWFQDRLEQAAFRTESLSGPLEDGSYVLDSVGQASGCKVEITIAPLGGITTLTFLYGASCPHS